MSDATNTPFPAIEKPQYWRTILLASNFPSLAAKVKLVPFDPQRFHEATRAFSSGERHAADFVLSVFNPTEWRFDLHDAMGIWDRAHRMVFLDWAMNPFWE